MRMFVRSFASAAAMVFLVLVPCQPVGASIMNFESVPPGAFLSSGFSQDGIQLSLLSGHYDAWTCSLLSFCPAANGVVGGLDILTLGPPSSVRISLLSGTLFNLESLEIVAALHLQNESSFLTASDGRMIFFNAPGQLGGLRGIEYFDLSSNVGIAGAFLFDNIVVTPVPEPSTAPAILGLLVFGISMSGRRLKENII
jgi:hypothetical protein